MFQLYSSCIKNRSEQKTVLRHLECIFIRLLLTLFQITKLTGKSEFGKVEIIRLRCCYMIFAETLLEGQTFARRCIFQETCTTFAAVWGVGVPASREGSRAVRAGVAWRGWGVAWRGAWCDSPRRGVRWRSSGAAEQRDSLRQGRARCPV